MNEDLAGPLEGPESFRVLEALSCYRSLILNHFDTKWDKNNHSQSKFTGGGGAPVDIPVGLDI